MRDLHDSLAPTRAIQAQTITSSPLVSGNLDLAGFEAAEVLVDFGDIDEMGSSPEGGAQIAIKLEHAADDGTGSPGSYAEVALADVLGPGSVSGGVVSTVTTDAAPVAVGYVGGRRFLRVTLTPTALTNGGPVGCWLFKGRPRHAPA
jgi:hypothetical protein